MLPKTSIPSAIILAASLALVTNSAPAVPTAVQEFPLGDVRLLDSPFKQAMERNAQYLLSIEPDRLLHNTRQYAGLKPKGELYGGWEAQGIAGHTLGHYLTAISQQYAATGDKRFKDRLDYIIREMAECQRAYKDGYVGALPPKELQTLRDLKQGKLDVGGGFNFKSGAWVPWYTQHKVLAGLIDAWTLGGNPQAKEVTLKLANWVDDVTKPLTPDQMQSMLGIEHGGMLESLVQIYALTGDKRYLEVSKRFYHRAILDPLAAGKDELTGRHANTQIPKIIGEARTYEVTGDENGRKIAEFFWNTVVHTRSWANGGNSDYEHFFPTGTGRGHLSPAASESCNTYNMLKLTEHLFEWQPTVERADYYERALYNHILGSQEPKKGMYTYFISLKPGLFKTFSTPFDSFWCCVGTGMENHTKYGEAIYFHGANELYVNLFLPSVLTWREKGLVLEQDTNYPNENTSVLTIQSAPVLPIKLMVRCPAWATGRLEFRLNGLPLMIPAQPGQFAEITRRWNRGDRLQITIPMGLHQEKLDGDPNKLAFFYGPILLAGDLGAVPETNSFPYAKNQLDNGRTPTVDVPVLVRAAGGAEDLTSSIKRLPGQELAFQIDGISKPTPVTLRPLNSIFYQRYNVYWDVISEADWNTRQGQIEAAAEKRRQEEARFVDEINFGQQQSEVDHHLTSDRSGAGDFRDHKFRDAKDGGFFEFQMKSQPGTAQVLRCTYWGDDSGNREFEILVNGKSIANQKLDRNQPGKFFDVEYPLPADVTANGGMISVRFQPHLGSVAGRVFGCAVLKAEK